MAKSQMQVLQSEVHTLQIQVSKLSECFGASVILNLQELMRVEVYRLLRGAASHVAAAIPGPEAVTAKTISCENDASAQS